MRHTERDGNLTIVRHPLVEDKLTRARDRQTDGHCFRELVGELTTLIAVELLRDCPTQSAEIDTPVGACVGRTLSAEITLVPILRGGLPMAEAMLRLLPSARVGHVGVYRDRASLQPVVYYNKLPPQIARCHVILLDPMLASGLSCSSACDLIEQAGAKQISLVCLVAAPEGVARMREEHANVAIYAAAVDEGLDESGYVVPGLGDAAGRMFGTV